MNSPAAEAPATPHEIRAVFLALMIVLGLGAVDQSIVSTALPRIIGEFGGIAHLSWVVTAYVLTSTATMPLYGKLSDQYGRKPVLYAAILLFLLGSALSGMAQNLVQLILFRGVQGMGAGGLMPLAQIIIGDLVPPANRGERQGTIVAVFAVCSILGPVLGGVITDLLSWRWIFYVNLPIGLVSLVVLARALRRPNVTHTRRIDYLGAVLLTGATTTFLLVLALGGTEWSWTSRALRWTSGLSLGLAILFILHFRRVPEPIMPLLLFGDRLFVVACTVMALTFMGMQGAGLFFPLYFQLVKGIDPSLSGCLTGPLMVGVTISAIFNGRVLLRGGRYKPAQIAGLATACLAFAGLSWGMAANKPLALIEPAIFATGLGLGLVMPNMTIAVQNALSFAHRGVGTATLAFFRSLGGLLGVTGAGTILSLRLHAANLSIGLLPPAWGTVSALSIVDLSVYRQAIAAVFGVGAGVTALALVILFLLPEL